MKKQVAYLLCMIAFLLLNATTCLEEEADLYLIGLQTVHINNEKDIREMFVTNEPVKKEAYGIGIKYLAVNKNFPTDTLTRFSDVEHGIVNINGEPKIYCNTDFDQDHPAGSEVSAFFWIASDHSLGQNKLLILKQAPQKGMHSFKIVFDCSDNTTVVKDTDLIELY